MPSTESLVGPGPGWSSSTLAGWAGSRAAPVERADQEWLLACREWSDGVQTVEPAVLARCCRTAPAVLICAWGRERTFQKGRMQHAAFGDVGRDQMVAYSDDARVVI
jgi:hypothetical protein